MATNTIPSKPIVASPRSGATEFVQATLAPLASLKLTVWLLVLGIVVTFIATLDQTRADVFQVKMKHFSSVFVEVPLQTLFVPAWFPDLQNIPGSFYIPSGATILVLMLLNLTAAHVLRFRLQAKGAQRWIGLAVGLFAGFLTWAVIFNGQNPDGFQAQPPISWRVMWILMQIGVLLMAIAAAVSFFLMGRDRTLERTLVGLAGLICGATLILTLFLGEDVIGESAMRILWQLIQSTMAALVSYLACLILFRRKAGIVLLHLGIAGLMLNEIFVTVTNEEQRMRIFEGETVSQTMDVRETEMAIINVSDPEFDEIVVVPGALLESEELISNSDLPFDVKCIQYIPNSDLRPRRPGSMTANLATEGMGLRFETVEVPVTAGTDSEQTVDLASAFVEIIDKPTGTSKGIHLITQLLDVSTADTITVDGKPYQITLRFKTAYKPYSLTLKDAQRENYIGTDTPSYYGSEVVLHDFENGLKSDQRVWMNNPLRYSDETFYQSGMDTLPNGREYTILQIVRNKGWMIPYVCCMFTVVGLIAQFGGTLLGFIEKRRNQQSAVNRNSASSVHGARVVPTQPVKQTADGVPLASFADVEHQSRFKRWKVWIPTIVLVGFFGLWTIGQLTKASRGTLVHQEMRMDLLGKIPITINGRVQPLDSFARNTARQLSKRESVFDGNDKKQPAIVWLADTMFEAKGYDEYRVFRIEDKTISGALDLPTEFAPPRGDNSHSGQFRFTLSEMLEAEPRMRELIPDSREQDPKYWSKFEKRLESVSRLLQRTYGVKLAFGGPDRSDDDLLMRLEDAGRSLSSPLIPLVVPNDDADQPWMSFLTFQNQVWLQSLAEKYDADTTSTLARAIIETEILPPMRADTIQNRIIQRFLSEPEFLAEMEKQHGETDPRVLARLMKQNWDEFPENIKTQLIATEGPLVDALIAQQMPKYLSVMEEQLIAINGKQGEINTGETKFASLLLKLRPAYLAGDAATFNSTLESYLAEVNADPPKKFNPTTAKLEGFYNWLSPFYMASVMYLAAFLIAQLSWITWTTAWNRAAFGLLLLGLSVHVLGLVSRIVISGRPPVTNLYSSVLFVSAGVVVLMLIVEKITKMGIGSYLAGGAAFSGLLWAWTMSIADGDTFSVMVAVLDTQFWLATHVVCISIGYAATFVAGLLGVGYLIGAFVSPAFRTKRKRREFANVIYGIVCFGLLCSFFGTVLGGLWGDDSWGRFWGWDPKENGALMIVLWNAVVLHARWGGMVRERGLAALAAVGNVVVLWSWKGVNAMGVGLHAYAGTEDSTLQMILIFGAAHLVVACLVAIPTTMWMSYVKDDPTAPRSES